MLKKILSILFGLAFLLVACRPQADVGNKKDVMVTSTAASGDMIENPNWYGVSFIDAASGAPFSINDFRGKVVLVETLAMWCTNCLSQQKQELVLHGLLGDRNDFINIGLDIDSNEKLSDLKAYIASNGFNWTYAIATPDVTREFGNLYGNQFLNPSSTPMLIIDRSGKVHPLPFGIKSAKELMNELTPYLDSDS
jgi:thiol-disulfide isomerase/thioredoxin